MKGSTLPGGLLITDVHRIGDNPVAGGGFADVWKGWHKKEDVALKVLRIFGNPEDRANTYKVSLNHVSGNHTRYIYHGLCFQDFCKEAMLWKLFKHDNICPFYGVCVDEFAPQYAFVSPWMPNGNLLGYVKAHPEVDRIQIVSNTLLSVPDSSSNQ